MNLIQQKQLALNALIKMRYVPRALDRRVGICANIISNTPVGADYQDLVQIQRDLFKLWPEYTDQPEYPVPCEGLRPERVYKKTEDKWDTDTAYGQARWRLLDFMISELTAQTQTSGETQ
jgi:hypothetical protein